MRALSAAGCDHSGSHGRRRRRSAAEQARAAGLSSARTTAPASARTRAGSLLLSVLCHATLISPLVVIGRERRILVTSDITTTENRSRSDDECYRGPGGQEGGAVDPPDTLMFRAKLCDLAISDYRAIAHDTDDGLRVIGLLRFGDGARERETRKQRRDSVRQRFVAAAGSSEEPAKFEECARSASEWRT